jgi:hypothetical protein
VNATTFTVKVFDICHVDQTSAVRHVAASGPGGHVGWTTTNPPARGTRVAVTITTNEGNPMNRPSKVADMLGVWDAQGVYPLRRTDDVAALVAWIKTLEQRNDAAVAHIDRARALAPDLFAPSAAFGVIGAELVAALDVLRGDAC